MMTNFRNTVYAVVRSIPKGLVATYGQVAELAGRPGAARAVGTCMRTTPSTESVPCHRVISSDGSLGGYGTGVSTKKKLLHAEGVQFRGEKVNLKESQWQPRIGR